MYAALTVFPAAIDYGLIYDVAYPHMREYVLFRGIYPGDPNFGSVGFLATHLEGQLGLIPSQATEVANFMYNLWAEHGVDWSGVRQAVIWFVNAQNYACPGCMAGSGAQGPAGPQGPQGIQGAQGIPGGVGPMGPAGDRGTTGADGQRGPQGTTGFPGAAGPMGPAGTPGAAGPMGPAGTPGAAGAPGSIGPVGPAGPQGAQGPAGPQGERGAQGDTGAAGAVGIPATPGRPLTWVEVFDIMRHMANVHAAQNSGEGLYPDAFYYYLHRYAFLDWERAAALTSARWNFLEVNGRWPNRVEFSDLATQMFGADYPLIPVPERGAQGPAGPQGTQGIQGAQGVQGNQGAPGQAGAPGVQGPAGQAGSPGGPGSQGPAGQAGAPGADADDSTGLTVALSLAAIVVSVIVSRQWGR